jgi:hypothetical protein
LEKKAIFSEELKDFNHRKYDQALILALANYQPFFQFAFPISSVNTRKQHTPNIKKTDGI